MTEPTAAPTVGLPDEWARLNPLSPLIYGGRAAVGLVGLAALHGVSHDNTPWATFALILIALVGGLIRWRVTRWRVFGGELQINTGLVRRQQIRVPITRIQGIDLVRPLLARALGLSEVRLVLAGHDTARARLSYLTEARAAEVRARLLALAHGLDDQTPEATAYPLLHVPGGRIIVANILTTRFVVGVVVLAGSITAVAISPALFGVLVAVTFALLAASLLVAARQTTAEWEFHLSEAPDGLRISSGLLQTRAETIPHGRIQAIRWIEPLMWRPLGWVRLEVDVARRRNANRGERESGFTSRALLPAGTREQARWVLGRALPGAAGELQPADSVPRRAFWRVPLGRRYARLQHNDSYASCSTGRLRPDVVIVPLEKVQSIRWSQGPWSRLLGLATVDLDTAGQRFTGRARFRDTEQADRLMTTLPDLARAARTGAAARRAADVRPAPPGPVPPSPVPPDQAPPSDHQSR